MAMYLKLEAVRAGDDVPDFMAWSGLHELPWFWEPFASPLFAGAGGCARCPCCCAGLLGFLVFRSRVQGVYFSIITQALALILSTPVVGQQPYTGGTNGMTNFTTMLRRCPSTTYARSGCSTS